MKKTIKKKTVSQGSVSATSTEHVVAAPVTPAVHASSSSSHSTAATEVPAPVTHVSIASIAVPAVVTPSATSAASGTTATAASPVFNPPPELSSIPNAPAGNTNASATSFRGTTPRAMELAVMPEVIAELQRFSEYAAVFGRTAPPQSAVVQTFTAAGLWSAMRVKIATWDGYCHTQEGLVWIDVRSLTEQLRPAFELAISVDGTLSRQFPALVRFFDVKRVIAQKGVATRKVNEKNKAEGKTPTKGKTAQRLKKAQKAAAFLAEIGQPVGAASTAAAAAPSGATQTPSPVYVTAAAPVAAAASAPAAASNGGAAAAPVAAGGGSATSALNGAAH